MVCLFPRYSKRVEKSKSMIGELNHFYGKSHTEETKNIIKENASKRLGEKNSFFNKTHSIETRKKLKLINFNKKQLESWHYIC